MVWVLIVAIHVYGGTAVTFQEFNGEAACSRALAAVTAMRAQMDGAVCLPKGPA